MHFVYAKFSNYGRSIAGAEIVEFVGNDGPAAFAAWAVANGYTERASADAYCAGCIGVAYIGASIDRTFCALAAKSIRDAALAGAKIFAALSD